MNFKLLPSNLVQPSWKKAHLINRGNPMMTRMYMQPWHELATMQNQLERMLGLPQTSNRPAVNSARAGIKWTPASGVHTTEPAGM